MKACHIINIALLQSIAEIKTQSTMKRAQRILALHIPQKPSKRKISRSTNEVLHAYVTARTQRTRVFCTHAMEATNCHQNFQAINQLSRHRRQPPPTHSEGIVDMDRLNMPSKAAEVRIEFAMLSSQCKTTREWEASAYLRDIGVRASACDRYINKKMIVWGGEA
jgi:hypothetical protein